MLTALGRNPATVQLVQWFDFDHLPEGAVRGMSARFAHLAEDLLRTLPDSPELSAGLRKLLESKDCCVRASIAHQRGDA